MAQNRLRFLFPLALLFSSACVETSATTYEETAACCESAGETLRVMTVNLAHGRKDAKSHFGVSAEQTRRNLEDVAEVVWREDAEVVALQEADGESFTSRGFDHVAYLTQTAEFGWYVRGSHARGPGMDYGTALIGTVPVVDAYAEEFTTFGPVLSKGYTVATVAIDGLEVDVVSVHLDPLLGARRRRQVDQIIEDMQARGRPCILMGDFNVEWRKDNPLDRIMQALSLVTYRAQDPELTTFGGARRLDWILVSPELELLSHEILPDVLSDHQALVAEIGVRPKHPVSSN